MTTTITIGDVYNELKKIEGMMLTKTDLDQVFQTMAILANDETMKQIVASEEEIAAGGGREIKCVHDLLR